MPLWLRKFTYMKMKEHYDAQSGENPDDYLVNEGGPQSKGPQKGPVVPKEVQQAAANYSVKAPKAKK